MHRLINAFLDQPRGKKLLMIAAFFFVLCLLFVFSIYMAGVVIINLDFIPENLTNTNYVKPDPFYVALHQDSGKFLSGFICLVVLFVLFYSVFRLNKKNYSGKADDRGVHYMKQGTYGTSKWLPKEKISEHYTECDIKDTATTIYGQITGQGEHVVGLKRDKYGSSNRNVVVIANAGSGKSRCYVRNELLNATRRGFVDDFGDFTDEMPNSFITTDPKGELYRDLAGYCRSVGMDVKVLNMKKPELSDCWDMFEETINPDTERLDSDRLNSFTNIFMQNSSGEQTKEFWYFTALNLISAVIGYTSYTHEKTMIDRYENLLNIVDIKKEKIGELSRKMKGSMISFKEIKNEIRKLAIKNDLNLDEVEKSFIKIKECADIEAPYNLSSVIDNILKVESPVLKEAMSRIPPWHPAYMYYLTFMSNDTPENKKSAEQNSIIRFRDFFSEGIRKTLSHPGIHISDINKKRCAWFVITDDTAEGVKTKPVVSLFFSFLFTDTVKNYDDGQDIAESTGKPNSCLPLVCMLDEAFSLGTLTGSAEGFGNVLSTARSRNIWISTIWQTYSQIKAVYGEEIGDVIQGNCKTLLYLGGNDPTTLDFISKFSGEATVLKETHDELNNMLGTEALKASYRSTADKRYLLTPGEAREWKNQVLVIDQGVKPMKLNPFGWEEHPLHDKCTKSSINSDYVPVQNRNLDKNLLEILNELSISENNIVEDAD